MLVSPKEVHHMSDSQLSDGTGCICGALTPDLRASPSLAPAVSDSHAPLTEFQGMLEAAMPFCLDMPGGFQLHCSSSSWILENSEGLHPKREAESPLVPDLLCGPSLLRKALASTPQLSFFLSSCLLSLSKTREFPTGAEKHT